MDYYPLLTYAHIIAFVYWLGADLGTYLASRQVVRRDLGVEARQVALKILMACDQGPRLAMPATFAAGFQLAVSLGYLVSPAWLTATVWIVCIVWFVDVLILYIFAGKPFTARLATIDFRFRVLVMLLLLAACAHGFAGGDWLIDDRIGWKMLIFAALIGCGAVVRLHLREFGPAFGTLVAKGADDAVNETLERSLGRCRPWVWAIWVGLFVNAALGVRLL